MITVEQETGEVRDQFHKNSEFDGAEYQPGDKGAAAKSGSDEEQELQLWRSHHSGQVRGKKSNQVEMQWQDIH